MAARRYDPKCEELARYFLDFPPTGETACAPDEETVSELAGVIQEAIENWNYAREN